MKTYWRLWKSGWMTVVAAIFVAVGFHAIDGVISFFVKENPFIHNALSAAAFLIIGLPYFGWVLEMATGQLERYRTKNDKTDPLTKA